MYATVERSAVLSLLREHLQQNLVRIGRRWHRQKQGIPQVGGTLGLSAACPAMQQWAWWLGSAIDSPQTVGRDLL